MKIITVDTLDNEGQVIQQRFFTNMTDALIHAYNTPGKKNVHW